MIECVFTHINNLKISTSDSSTVTISKSYFDGTMSKDNDVNIISDGPNLKPTELELSNIGNLMKEFKAISHKAQVKDFRLVSLMISSIKDPLHIHTGGKGLRN